MKYPRHGEEDVSKSDVNLWVKSSTEKSGMRVKIWELAAHSSPGKELRQAP